MPGGFLYNGSTYTSIVDPLGADGTFPTGISGGTIIGNINTDSGQYGFVYNGSTYTQLNCPLANGGSATYPLGISCSNIVGYYSTSNGTTGALHGFLYE